MSSLNNLQALYYRLERFEEALPIAERVLRVGRRIRGDRHPGTLTAQHNLAIVQHLGCEEEAEHLFNNALDGS